MYNSIFSSISCLPKHLHLKLHSLTLTTMKMLAEHTNKQYPLMGKQPASPSPSSSSPPSSQSHLLSFILPFLLSSLLPSLLLSLPPFLLSTLSPIYIPSLLPSLSPSYIPSLSPSYIPSLLPSLSPSYIPFLSPSYPPSLPPTLPSLPSAPRGNVLAPLNYAILLFNHNQTRAAAKQFSLFESNFEKGTLQHGDQEVRILKGRAACRGFEHHLSSSLFIFHGERDVPVGYIAFAMI